MLVQLIGRAGGDFVLVKAAGDSQMCLGERIVVPADAADDGQIIGDEGIAFEPLPAGVSDAAGQVLFKESIAVVAVGPKFVVAGDEEFWASELESREALLDEVAVAGGGVAD